MASLKNVRPPEYFYLDITAVVLLKIKRLTFFLHFIQGKHLAWQTLPT